MKQVLEPKKVIPQPQVVVEVNSVTQASLGLIYEPESGLEGCSFVQLDDYTLQWLIIRLIEIASARKLNLSGIEFRIA